MLGYVGINNQMQYVREVTFLTGYRKKTKSLSENTFFLLLYLNNLFKALMLF